MENIIPIIPFHGQDGINAVSARALYEFLYGCDTNGNFSRWAKQGFTENQDAILGQDWVSVLSDGNSQGGRPASDYALRLDFAKKLAMMARSDRGELVRQYFLKCEEIAKAPAAVRDWLAMSEDEQALAYFSERKTRKALELTQATQAPLVAYAEKVQGSPTSEKVDTVGKELGFPVVKFREFVQSKFLFRRGRDWLPYESQTRKGWFEISTRTYEHNGVNITYHTTLVTGLGRIKLKEAFERAQTPVIAQ